MDLFAALESSWKVRMVYWITILSMAALMIYGWFDLGPDNPAYALVVAGWTFFLGPGLAAPSMRFLPPRWFRVPAGEHILHRVLGVGIFGWLLERSGYNRHAVYPSWGSSITRTRLLFRAVAARAGAGAHGACFAIHAILAAVALFSGYAWGALWILLPGVIVHLYPLLLQRSIMLRLQPLLDKYGSSNLG